MPRAKILCIGALASVALLAALELALRVAGYERRGVEPPAILWDPEQDASFDREGALHHRSRTQLWEPRPGAELPWTDGERLNSLGLRGPEPAREPDLLRVALCGDSSTFGLGLTWLETWASRLVAELDGRGVRAEVLDAGVIGTTIEQGLVRYREVVRPLGPDVVVVAYGAYNEAFPALGGSDADKVARSSAAWSGFAARVRRELRCVQLAASLFATDGDLAGVPSPAPSARDLAQWGAVDWNGTRRVPLERFDELLERFAAEARADGAHVLFASLPRAPELERLCPVLVAYTHAVELASERDQVALVDLRARAQIELGRRGSWSPMFRDSLHPGPEAAGWIAAEVATAIAAELERARR